MCLFCIGKVEIAEKNIKAYKEVLTFKNEKDVWYPIVMTQRGAHKFNQILIASKVIYTNIGITFMPIEHLNPYPGKYDHRMLISEGFHSHMVRLPNTKICIIPKNSDPISKITLQDALAKGHVLLEDFDKQLRNGSN